MEFDKIVKLIHAVGESGLSEFSFALGLYPSGRFDIKKHR